MSTNIIIDKILNATEYSGETKKNIKAISASNIGSDPQEVLLRYKYGVIKDNKVGQNTLGSLVHLGIEQIFKDNPQFRVEYKPHGLELYPDWFLTGTIDLVDLSNKIIYDVKVTKTYAIEKIKNQQMEQYTWQLTAYKYLLDKATGDNYQTKIIAFNKQGGFDARSGKDIPSVEILDVNTYSVYALKTKFKELVQFIELNQEVRCQDVYLRKVKGRAIPLKCEKYCSYKSVCKVYNPKPETSIQGWDI